MDMKKTVSVVIGGAGFLGTAIVSKLYQHKTEVIVIDPLEEIPNPLDILKKSDRHTVFDRILAKEDIEGVFVYNLAAFVAGVEFNQNNQFAMLEKNLALQIAGVSFAEELEKRLDTRAFVRFIQISSACVYGDGMMSPAVERYAFLTEPVGANNGYSWAKRIGEKAVQLSTLSHACIARPFNLYGPNDHYGPLAHVIPAMIERFLGKEEEVTFNGTGNEIREFVYVEDCATALIAIALSGVHKEIYNIGTNGDTRISMRELAQTIKELSSSDKTYTFKAKFDAGDKERWSNSEKLNRLGWRHQNTLQEGLAKTIASYRKEKGLVS